MKKNPAPGKLPEFLSNHDFEELDDSRQISCQEINSTYNFWEKKLSPQEIEEVNNLVANLRHQFCEIFNYNYELKKCQSYKECEDVFKKMKKNNVRLNIATFNIILSKCQSDKERDGILKKMEKGGIEPNIFTFNIILSKCQSDKERDEILKKMEKGGIGPNAATFNILLNNCKSHEEGKNVFKEMEKSGIDPNVVTFTTLLKKCQSHKECKEIFVEMKNKKIYPDVITLTTWLKKCQSHEECEEVFGKMVKKKIEPNNVTLITFISLRLDQTDKVRLLDFFNKLLAKSTKHLYWWLPYSQYLESKTHIKNPSNQKVNTPSSSAVSSLPPAPPITISGTPDPIITTNNPSPSEIEATDPVDKLISSIQSISTKNINAFIRVLNSAQKSHIISSKTKVIARNTAKKIIEEGNTSLEEIKKKVISIIKSRGNNKKNKKH